MVTKMKSTLIAGLLSAAYLCTMVLPCNAATPKLYEKLGNKNLDIIKNANHITMLLFVPKPKKGKLDEIYLTEEQMRRLKTNLLDDHNYDFTQGQHCRFMPEISFKFQTKNDEILHLFINQSCSQILFGTGDHSVLLNYSAAHQRLEHFFDELISEGYAKNKLRDFSKAGF